MFSKVSVFVDSSLKRLTEWMPGQNNNPAWKTCFDLIPFFLPLSPHGICNDAILIKDPKELLQPICHKLHVLKEDHCSFSRTPLSEMVYQAKRIEVVIRHEVGKCIREDNHTHKVGKCIYDDDHYVWKLSYFMKGQKKPAASVTIKMLWNGEITECNLEDMTEEETPTLRKATTA